MDRKLLDILCCPTTRQSLALLDPQGLDALNRAIAAGGVKRADDSPQAARWAAQPLTALWQEPSASSTCCMNIDSATVGG